MGRQVQRLVRLASLFAAVLLTSGAAYPNSTHDQLDAIEDRLGRVTSRINALLTHVDKRLDAEQIARGILFMNRILRLQEPKCADTEFLCDFSEYQCVSKLFMCDGVQDCRSGADETQCVMPFKAKDVYYGEEVFDECVLRRPGALTVVIKEIKSPPFYPGNPNVKVVIIVNFHDKVIRGSVALPSDGYYSYADRRLVITPPLPNVRRLVCKFDGVRDHVFIGDVMTHTQRSACARFRFTRK